MPPALLTRSAHHSVPRSPAVPTGAAMPARIARMPIFTSGACARATSGNPPIALAAATDLLPHLDLRHLAVGVLEDELLALAVEQLREEPAIAALAARPRQ